jgi:hypothetical protein
MRVITLLLLLLAAALAHAEPPREAAFTIWDWTAPCRDLDTFDTWLADLVTLGFTRVEISAPWKLLEPEPGLHDLSFIADRLRIAQKHGLGMRVRINSCWGGARPAWYDGALWKNEAGEVPLEGLPSISDETFWAHFAPLCTALAKEFAGHDLYWSPFIGVHAEVKWADWWHYDEATLAKWRESIADPRPEWLRDVVADDVPLPEHPPVPPPTQGIPDSNPVHTAVIAFREQCWRDAVARFVTAIRAGDPVAKISIPLGESYRRESAHMANLDYWGYTRGAEQVVHSYDFFWHAADPPWMAAASVAAFQGITGLPVVFELDGPTLLSNHGYTVEQLVALGRAAHGQGSGLNVSNWSYTGALPSTHETVRAYADIWREPAMVPQASPEETTLLFISKWVTYQYREPTEWLHNAQFGLWKWMRDRDVPVRIINEDNLTEDLRIYRECINTFSPRPLMPVSARARLDALARGEAR